MKEEQHQFLRLLGQLPARLTAEQAAWVLNCQTHDVPILVAARLLMRLPIGWTRPRKPLASSGGGRMQGAMDYLAKELTRPYSFIK